MTLQVVASPMNVILVLENILVLMNKKNIFIVPASGDGNFNQTQQTPRWRRERQLNQGTLTEGKTQYNFLLVQTTNQFRSTHFHI
jgi:hypothetical protein